MLGDRAADVTLGMVQEAADTIVDFRIPGFPPFHVCASKVLNEQTGELDFILPSDTICVTSPPGVPTDGERIATSYTFRRKGPSGVGFSTREVRIETRGLGGTLIIANMADIAIMTGNNCGGIIKSCHQ